MQDVNIGYVHGGHLTEIPMPHKRMFPGRKKRRVRVHWHSWAGAGGHHYYVTITEEGNPIYNVSRHCWQQAWDDTKYKGIYLSDKFANTVLARAWVQKMQRENFPRKTHILEWESGDTRKWFYREGD